jgi:hypothetical protein
MDLLIALKKADFSGRFNGARIQIIWFRGTVDASQSFCPHCCPRTMNKYLNWQ